MHVKYLKYTRLNKVKIFDSDTVCIENINLVTLSIADIWFKNEIISEVIQNLDLLQIYIVLKSTIAFNEHFPYCSACIFSTLYIYLKILSNFLHVYKFTFNTYKIY